MTGFWLLVAHLVGDYLLQSDWMANEKTKKSVAALAHVATYVLPFVLVTHSPTALAFIAGTHFVIDRWRLARYACWLKNFLAPSTTTDPIPPGTDPQSLLNVIRTETRWWHPWSECVGTGYHKDRPPWMAVWLMIIADNTMHLVCNGVAIELWG